MTDKSLRTPAALVEAGLASASELAALDAVAARYAVAITPALAALIDPSDPNDPIARQFVPDPAELATQSGGTRRPDRRRRSEPGRGPRAPLSRPRAVEARPCLPGLLPLLLPPRHGRTARPPKPVARPARGRARLYPSARGNLGSHPHRRRSAHPVRPQAERGSARALAASIMSRSSASIPAFRWRRPS